MRRAGTRSGTPAASPTAASTAAPRLLLGNYGGLGSRGTEEDSLARDDDGGYAGC